MKRLHACAALLTVFLVGCGSETPEPEPPEATPDATLPAGPDIWVAALTPGEGGPTLGELRNVTAREGYDNQPYFLPDGSLLYTRQEGERTDIWRWDAATGESTPVTRTDPESEYSPTLLPSGDGFSAVRVEADSTQRLWRFAMDGSGAEVILPDLAPVGYHAWIGSDTLALFVLGDPATLRLARASGGEAVTLASDIGRSLQPVPGRHAFSYVQREGEGATRIRVRDLATGTTEDVAHGVGGADFHAWTPDGHLLQADGGRLMRWDADMGHWMQIADLTERGVSLSRIAVSPDGRWIALVAEPEGDGS